MDKPLHGPGCPTDSTSPVDPAEAEELPCAKPVVTVRVLKAWDMSEKADLQPGVTRSRYLVVSRSIKYVSTCLVEHWVWGTMGTFIAEVFVVSGESVGAPIDDLLNSCIQNSRVFEKHDSMLAQKLAAIHDSTPHNRAVDPQH